MLRNYRLRLTKNQAGTSLLDVVFGTALLLVVFVGLYGAFQLTLELVQSSKSKTGALALANERMEYIRSLEYDDIGTVGGIPSGVLDGEDSEVLNGITYTRRVLVRYVDAPEDGVGGSDLNGITTDYKVVKVTLDWDFRGETRSFFLVTNIVPQGVESIAGGGTLRITVLDSLGAPLPSAQVSVVNNAVSPAVSLSTFTNVSGVVEFPGAPSASSYEITVSKSGHSSTQTYSVAGENVTPSPGHLTVSVGQTTSSSFSIDTTGSITVNTFEVGTTTPLQNITLSMQGDKTIGSDSDEDPIYKYSTTIDTGSLGSVTTNNLEWDNYTITINDSVEGYDIAEACVPQPLSLLPGETETVVIYLAEDTPHSLLVDVKNSSGTVLNGATVRLYRAGYDTSIVAGSCGQSFFNNSVGQGTIGGGSSYSLDVSLSGYTATTVNNVEVDGASRSSVVLNSI
ncbi:MAG: carboxypeptidase regulatory-like domain-containing protein [Candidatus Paceibacterota bacterium]